MRTVFFGTPSIAVPALRALFETTQLVAVVCQPDRPSGRGLKIAPPPVKAAAVDLGLTVHQPTKVRDGALAQWLLELAPDAAVVMAYGRILPAEVLAAPRRGCLNLHASLLPKYRGAAPINWAIIRGETNTGISLMQMDTGMDTGPVFSTRALAIGPEETSGELAERLADLAATVVRSDLADVLAGAVSAHPQDETYATPAPPFQPEDTAIDWSGSAENIKDFIRGLAPRPSAQTRHRGARLKVHAVALAPGRSPAAPGTIDICDRRVYVATGIGALELLRVQPEARRAQSVADLLNGRGLTAGEILGP